MIDNKRTLIEMKVAEYCHRMLALELGSDEFSKFVKRELGKGALSAAGSELVKLLAELDFRARRAARLAGVDTSAIEFTATSSTPPAPEN